MMWDLWLVSDEPFRSLKASRAEQPFLEVQDRAGLLMLQEANARKTAAKNAHRSRVRWAVSAGQSAAAKVLMCAACWRKKLCRKREKKKEADQNKSVDTDSKPR